MFSPNAVFVATLHGVWNSVVQMRNVFTLSTPAPDQLEASQVIDDVREYLDGWAALAKELAWDDMIWTGFDVRTQDSQFVSGFETLTASVPGVLVDDPLPSSIALLLSFPTNISRVIGHKFVPGPTKATIGSTGKFTATALSDALDLALYSVLPFEGTYAGWQYGIRSAKTVNFVPFFTFVAYNTPSPMVRRKQGVGI